MMKVEKCKPEKVMCDMESRRPLLAVPVFHGTPIPEPRKNRIERS